MLGRAVLGTDVLVAALRSDRGASRVLLKEAFGRRYPVLVSVALMLQYEAVMTRPKHLVAAGISEQDAGVVLDALAPPHRKRQGRRRSAGEWLRHT